MAWHRQGDKSFCELMKSQFTDIPGFNELLESYKILFIHEIFDNELLKFWKECSNCTHDGMTAMHFAKFQNHSITQNKLSKEMIFFYSEQI